MNIFCIFEYWQRSHSKKTDKMNITKETFTNWETRDLFDHKHYVESRPRYPHNLLTLECINQVLNER